jgi:hypothetical protein
METIGYTILRLSFMDRVRVLLGSVPHVTIKTSLNSRTLPEDFAMETSVHIPRLIERKYQVAYSEDKP